mmetsp:Transcript_76114/g.234977  ORF Transcript_76114/g.234977 Transcript_76114/m.234977 type:complete len:281 (-) Transcript_76114:148-990(-)
MDGVGGRKQEREQRVSSLEAREAGDHDALHEALRDDVCGLLVPDGVIPDEHLAVREGALFQFLVVGDRERLRPLRQGRGARPPRLNDGAEAIDTGPPFASQHRLLTLGDRAVRLVAVLRGIFLGRGPLRERRPRPSAPRPPGQTGDHRRAVDVFRKCSGRDAAVAGAGGARDEVGGAHPGAERGPTQAAFLRGPRARGNPRGVRLACRRHGELRHDGACRGQAVRRRRHCRSCRSRAPQRSQETPVDAPAPVLAQRPQMFGRVVPAARLGLRRCGWPKAR